MLVDMSSTWASNVSFPLVQGLYANHRGFSTGDDRFRACRCTCMGGTHAVDGDDTKHELAPQTAFQPHTPRLHLLQSGKIMFTYNKSIWFIQMVFWHQTYDRMKHFSYKNWILIVTVECLNIHVLITIMNIHRWPKHYEISILNSYSHIIYSFVTMNTQDL